MRLLVCRGSHGSAVNSRNSKHGQPNCCGQGPHLDDLLKRLLVNLYRRHRLLNIAQNHVQVLVVGLQNVSGKPGMSARTERRNEH